MTSFSDIELHFDDHLDRPYAVIGRIKARVTSGAFASFKRERSIEDVHERLREVAAGRGADAVIDVRYDRGWSWTSYKALTAYGTAVRFVESASPTAPPPTELAAPPHPPTPVPDPTRAVLDPPTPTAPPTPLDLLAEHLATWHPRVGLTRRSSYQKLERAHAAEHHSNGGYWPHAH